MNEENEGKTKTKQNKTKPYAYGNLTDYSKVSTHKLY